MLDPARYPFCSEFDVVEKSIVVVANVGGEDRQIRIDALRSPHGSTVRYRTVSYIKENFTIQPTYPSDSAGFTRRPENVSFWITYDLPWTDRTSADDALAQALSFLGDRAKRNDA